MCIVTLIHSLWNLSIYNTFSSFCWDQESKNAGRPTFSRASKVPFYTLIRLSRSHSHSCSSDINRFQMKRYNVFRLCEKVSINTAINLAIKSARIPLKASLWRPKLPLNHRLTENPMSSILFLPLFLSFCVSACLFVMWWNPMNIISIDGS